MTTLLFGAPALSYLADTAGPLRLLNLRVPAPLLERLKAKAGSLNANRAAVARYSLILGLEQLEPIEAAAGNQALGLVSPCVRAQDGNRGEQGKLRRNRFDSMPTLPAPSLAHLANTAAPLQLLNLRIPGPLLEKLDAQAAAINASRAALARYALAQGLALLELQTDANHEQT